MILTDDFDGLSADIQHWKTSIVTPLRVQSIPVIFYFASDYSSRQQHNLLYNHSWKWYSGSMRRILFFFLVYCKAQPAHLLTSNLLSINRKHRLSASLYLLYTYTREPVHVTIVDFILSIIWVSESITLHTATLLTPMATRGSSPKNRLRPVRGVQKPKFAGGRRRWRREWNRAHLSRG